MIDENLLNKIREKNREKIEEYKKILENIAMVYRLTGKTLTHRIPVSEGSKIFNTISFGFNTNHINLQTPRFSRSIMLDDYDDMEIINLVVDNKEGIKTELENLLNKYLGLQAS